MKYKINERVKVRRSIGRRTWLLLSYLPFPIRSTIIRRFFKADIELDSDIVFKRAETEDEIEQAFKVAFEGFYERGLVEETKSRMRVTKFHALPTSAILIAKKGDEVIATLTVVVDSGLGLPLESLWPVDELRRTSTRLAEVSTLAIKRGHRAQRGKILLPLTCFMYRYCRQILGVDTVVAAVHPEVIDFYRAILLFQDFTNWEIKTYEFVQGAAAIAGYLRLDQLPVSYKKVYGKKPVSRNLHAFFTETRFPQFIFPQREYQMASQFNLTPRAMQTFFREHSDVFETLTNEEKKIIANCYFYSIYRQVVGAEEGFSNRSHARFSISLPVRFRLEGEMTIHMGTALEVSRKGLKVALPREVEAALQSEVLLEINLNEDLRIPLMGEIVWVQKDFSQVGVQLDDWLPQTWLQFIEEFETTLLSAAQEKENVEKRFG